MVAKFLVPLLAWEIIVLGCLFVLMMINNKPLDSEHKVLLGVGAMFGPAVVLLSWPASRIVSRAFAIAIGAFIGLITPVLGCYFWGHFFTGYGQFTTPFELWILGLGLSIPSGMGGALVGIIQARRSDGDES